MQLKQVAESGYLILLLMLWKMFGQWKRFSFMLVGDKLTRLFSQFTALQSQVEFLEQSTVEKSLVSRQEAKIRELESKLEFEKTQVKRLEVSICL